MEIQNPSKKTQGKIKTEIYKMKQRIKSWSNIQNPSKKIKSELDLEKQKLEEVLKLFPDENKEIEIYLNFNCLCVKFKTLLFR